MNEDNFHVRLEMIGDVRFRLQAYYKVREVKIVNKKISFTSSNNTESELGSHRVFTVIEMLEINLISSFPAIKVKKDLKN
jgi:hypothetical protein